MPELPEVEAARKSLLPVAVNEKIIKVDVLSDAVIAHPSAEAFKTGLTGRTVTDIRRRGKYLIFQTDTTARLIVHFKLTGSFSGPPAYTRVILYFSSGQQLRYSDPRQLGRMWLIRESEFDIYSGVSKLGKEATDSSLTGAYLKSHLGRSMAPIKSKLMDQSVVAGVGNLYSDEILFAARINPSTPCHSLKPDQWERIAEETRGIMDLADTRNVYGRSGSACLVCGTELKKITIGGRSCTYCPVCQK